MGRLDPDEERAEDASDEDAPDRADSALDELVVAKILDGPSEEDCSEEGSTLDTLPVDEAELETSVIDVMSAGAVVDTSTEDELAASAEVEVGDELSLPVRVELEAEDGLVPPTTVETEVGDELITSVRVEVKAEGELEISLRADVEIEADIALEASVEDASIEVCSVDVVPPTSKVVDEGAVAVLD
ncbi:hypothetical protein TWF281_005178 [Arthrobotrys megalospora]